MGEIHGFHVQFLQRRMKISTIGLTLLASTGKKVGSSGNPQFCCTLQMLEKAGKEFH